MRRQAALEVRFEVWSEPEATLKTHRAPKALGPEPNWNGTVIDA